MDEVEMKIPVGNIQKFSVEDGPGIRTTVFLKGCPLRCRWCHNPEMTRTGQQLIHSPNRCIRCGACMMACMQNAIAPDKERGIVIDRQTCVLCLACTELCFAEALRPVARWMSVEEIMGEVLQDKGFYENTGGGITLSGGEVLMHAEAALAITDAAAAQETGVCLDTCGYGDGDALLALASRENVTDILYDLKSMNDAVHQECTGVSNGLILENLRRLAEREPLREKITMRMPLVAGVNDGEEAIRQAGGFFKELGLAKVTLLPYHDLGLSKAVNAGLTQERFSAPTDERLDEIAAYFRDALGMETTIQGQV